MSVGKANSIAAARRGGDCGSAGRGTVTSLRRARLTEAAKKRLRSERLGRYGRLTVYETGAEGGA